MNATFGILWNVVRGRRLMFGLAALLGGLCLISPWILADRGADPAEVRDTTALVLSLIATLIGAAAMGGSLTVGHQVEGRLGFFFSRPISGLALWFGQIFGALASLAICWCLIWLPTWCFGGSPARFVDRSFLHNWAPHLPSSRPWDFPTSLEWIARWDPILPEVFAGANGGQMLFWWVSSCCVLLMMGHWLAMLLRQRTRWAILDLVLLMIAVVTLSTVFGQLYALLAFRELILSWHGIVWVLIVGLASAGAWQTARGGVLASAAHRVFSFTLWPLLVIPLVLFAWRVEELKDEQPENLESLFNLVAPPSGDWLVVSGKPWMLGSYEPVLAHRPAEGATHFLGPRFGVRGTPVFSRQGNVLVWNRCDRGPRGCDLEWLDLETQRRATLPSVSATPGLFWRGWENPWVLNDDGSLVAMADGDRFELYAMPEGRLITSRRFDEAHESEMVFDASGGLRLMRQFFSRNTCHLEVWKVHLSGEPWQLVSTLSGRLRDHHQVADRLAITQCGSNNTEIYDRWGQQFVGHLGKEASGLRIYSLRILSSGHLVTLEVGDRQETILRLRDPIGSTLHLHRLSQGQNVLLGGEVEAGRLLVGLRRPQAGDQTLNPTTWQVPGLGGFDRWSTHILDIDSGLGDPTWPGRIPSWHRAVTFEQGRWLISQRGVERLRMATTRPVSADGPHIEVEPVLILKSQGVGP